MTHALFPGSFDPPTLGHADLIGRAAQLFERVTIAVADHPTKDPLFSTEERLELLAATCAGLENVGVRRIGGLVVEACSAWGCQVIVRGLRAAGDFEYEAQMARTNRVLRPSVETVFLASDPSHAHISGTLVRQIARLGGDVRALAPEPVVRALAGRFRPSDGPG